MHHVIDGQKVDPSSDMSGFAGGVSKPTDHHGNQSAYLESSLRRNLEPMGETNWQQSVDAQHRLALGGQVTSALKPNDSWRSGGAEPRAGNISERSCSASNFEPRDESPDVEIIDVVWLALT
ncbi:hypothetical protein HDU96_010653 [Phlyctochytrium bullatum]|nr:hypothetical protein HDU96_010653 [Phlyctochytrium bullatum]